MRKRKDRLNVVLPQFDKHKSIDGIPNGGEILEPDDGANKSTDCCYCKLLD